MVKREGKGFVSVNRTQRPVRTTTTMSYLECIHIIDPHLDANEKRREPKGPTDYRPASNSFFVRENVTFMMPPTSASLTLYDAPIIIHVSEVTLIQTRTKIKTKIVEMSFLQSEILHG